MGMSRILPSLLTITLLSVSVFSQGKPASIKLFQFYPKAESPDAFAEKAEALFDRLKSEKDTTAFISIFKNSELAAKLRKLKGYTDLKPRISLIERPVFYISDENIIEFWLIPFGSEPPFQIGCGGCNCPSID